MISSTVHRKAGESVPGNKQTVKVWLRIREYSPVYVKDATLGSSTRLNTATLTSLVVLASLQIQGQS